MSISGISGASGLLSGGLIPPDPDVVAFLTATGITDPVQSGAIDTLVRSLKAIGTWNAFLFIYPMVGGTAARHAVNLKDPATFPISWIGPSTHNAQGVTGGGNSWGRVNYNNVVPTMGFYTKSSVRANDSAMGWWQLNDISIRSAIHPSWPDGNTYFDPASANDALVPRRIVPTSGPVGHCGHSYRVGRRTICWYNGAIVNTDAVAAQGLLPIVSAFGLMAVFTGLPPNNADSFSARTYSLFYVADAFNSTEFAANHAAFQAFQTTLGRAV